MSLVKDCTGRPIHAGDLIQVVNQAYAGDVCRVQVVNGPNRYNNGEVKLIRLSRFKGSPTWYWKHACNVRVMRDPDLDLAEGL